jgi:regulatory protein
LRYLAYRPRSEAEVRSYLHQRGYLPDIAENVIEKLRSLQYVNDESFARDWSLSRAQSHGYGPRRIEQELRAKGIGQSLVHDAVRDAFDQTDEESQAKRLLAKQFKGENFKEPKVLRRAVALLQRRGYSSKVIFDLLRFSTEED